MIPIQQPNNSYKYKLINEVVFQTEPGALELGFVVAPRTLHVVLLRNQVQNLLLEYLLLQF